MPWQDDDDGEEPIAIKMSGKLMSFDKSGKLKVSTCGSKSSFEVSFRPHPYPARCPG